MADTTVTARFRADTSDIQTKLDALQGKMQATQSKFAATGAAMQSAGKKLTLGLTAPLVGIGVAAGKSAMDFETSMAKIEGLVGVASDEVASMGDTILKTSSEFGVGANQAADALFFITSAGLRGADAMDVLESSMKASQIGLGDVSTVADLATSALNAYGPEVLSASDATDVLTSAVREGKLEASELSGAMGQVLPVASAMGVRFDEVGAAMAAMSRTGTNAATASTQLRGIMNSLLKPSKQAEETLSSMGLSAQGLRTQIREQGLLSTLQTLSSEFGSNEAAAAQVFGNVRALSGVLDLMGANADTTAAIFDSLTESTGATDKAFEVVSETAQFKLNQAMAEMKNALIGIGAVILPVFSTFAELLAGVVSRFNSLNPVVKTAAVVLGAVLAALGPMLWIGGKVITSLGTLAAAFTTVSTKVAAAVTRIKVQMRIMEMDIKTAMIKSQTRMGALGAAASVLGKKVVLAFRTMALAAKGLLLSFGPIGLVLAGVTVAMEIFMGQSADTERTVAELKETVDQTTGAFTDLSAAMLAEKLTMQLDPNTVQLLDNVGLGVDEMTAALIEGGDAVDAMGQKFNDAITPVMRAQAAIGNNVPLITAERNFGGLAKQVDQTRREMELQEIAQDKAADAISATGLTATEAAGDFGELEGAVEDTRTQVEMLNGMFSRFDKNVAMIRARDEASEYMRTIGENLAKTSRSLEGEGQAALKNRDAVIGAFESKRKELITWSEATDATAEEVSDRWFEMTQDVRRQLIDEGFTSRDLAKFLGEDGIDVASVRVERELRGAVGTMADRLGPFALREFKGVGTDLASGLASGIRAGYTSVEGEARLLVNRAEQAARDASATRSPSKKWKKLGGDLVSGLMIGLKSKDEELKGAAREIAQNLLDAATDVVDGWDAELERLSGIYDDALSEFNDFKNGITADLFGRLDLGAAVEQASATGGSVVDAFAEQAAGIGTFAQNLIDLTKTNLSQSAWEAVAGLSADRGTELSEMMLGAQGQTIIDGINKIYGDVDHMATAVGLMAAKKFYGEGVAQAQANYEGFRDNYGPNGPARKALERLMDNLARSLNRTSTITVKTVYEAAGIDGARALGGPVMANKAYLVGERGPEVLMMGPQSGTVIPNSMLGGSIPITSGGGGGIGGGGVTNVSINVNAGIGTDGAEVGRQVVEAIRKYERRTGPVFASA